MASRNDGLMGCLFLPDPVVDASHGWNNGGTAMIAETKKPLLSGF